MVVFRVSAEISSAIVASTAIAGLHFGQVMEARFNQGPLHYKSCDDNTVSNSPHEAQLAGFSFEET
jgi:hypothetical protein